MAECTKQMGCYTVVQGKYQLHVGDGTQATAFDYTDGQDFRIRLTREGGVLFGTVGDVAHTAAQKQEACGWRLAAALWGTLRRLCARRFEGTFSRPYSNPNPWDQYMVLGAQGMVSVDAT